MGILRTREIAIDKSDKSCHQLHTLCDTESHSTAGSTLRSSHTPLEGHCEMFKSFLFWSLQKCPFPSASLLASYILCIVLFCLFERVSFSSPGCSKIHYVSQAGLRLTAILLSNLPPLLFSTILTISDKICVRSLIFLPLQSKC